MELVLFGGIRSMSSDRSVLKRNTATLSQLMAVGAMSVLSCDQSIPVAEPQIEQQKQAIVSSQEAPSTSLPAAAPPEQSRQPTSESSRQSDEMVGFLHS